MRDNAWYAIVSRARHEKAVAQMLTATGVDNFLPTMISLRRWSDRLKKVEMPLFPGYVFVNLPAGVLEAQTDVLRVAGVARFVGSQGSAAAIPDHEIEGVRALIAGEMDYSPYPFLKAGRRVRIRGGSLDGVEGIFVRHEKDDKVVISIELIQRSVAVSVSNFDIEPVEDAILQMPESLRTTETQGRSRVESRSVQYSATDVEKV